MMRLTRRGFVIATTLVAVPTVAVPKLARAHFLRPHEPLDPRKAQSLPTTPLAIESGGTMHPFTVELATTERQRDTGLMHRTTLAQMSRRLSRRFTSSRQAPGIARIEQPDGRYGTNSGIHASPSRPAFGCD